MLITGLLTFLIASSPLWIVGVVAFFVVRAMLRHRRQRATTHQTAEPSSPVSPRPIRKE